MCSSPHWQVGLSWFREKLSPANREQRLSRWADFAKNCLPRIGSKELPRFREKYRALGRQKMGSNMRPRYIQFRNIRDRNISGLHCTIIADDPAMQQGACVPFQYKDHPSRYEHSHYKDKTILYLWWESLHKIMHQLSCLEKFMPHSVSCVSLLKIKQNIKPYILQISIKHMLYTKSCLS